LRKKLADERGVPPYVVLSDATLRELACVRPSSLPKMRAVYGIGDAKLKDIGPTFLTAIQEYCRTSAIAFDQSPRPLKALEVPNRAKRPSTGKDLAARLFREGAAITEVMHQTNRARATIMDYLAEFIRDFPPPSIAAWVDPGLYDRIAVAARKVGTERLKPI